MKNFAITGVAGYIAPRHLQAIRDTGNRLKAALDPHDSVGVLDQFFPEASFFTEFERFDRHLEKLQRSSPDNRIDFLSICSPNHLHDAHIRLALRIGAVAICEKPMVLNPWNLDLLEQLEQEFGRRVHTILQLRLHPALVQFRNTLKSPGNGHKHNVILTYITSRGSWYNYSWKGSTERSGGLATNIGIHFFDLLIWLYGKVQSVEVHRLDSRRVSGFLELERATVRWFLSIEAKDIPVSERDKGKTTFRSISVDESELEFSEGFTDLHTRAYEDILAGKGFGISDARPSIHLAYDIRNASIVYMPEKMHPIALEVSPLKLRV